jgi:septum formation protein
MRVSDPDLPPLILASASPRREALLRQLGLPFQVVLSRVEELQAEHLSPRELCQVNASRKARVVAKRHPDALVVGADTMVCLGRERFGKPRTMAEARRMLGRLQGQTHEVVTGVCLLHLRRHWQRMFAVQSSVSFHCLDDRALRRYLARVNPLDKAGAYAVQEHGELLVEEVSGSLTNVVGLPLSHLRQALDEWLAGLG